MIAHEFSNILTAQGYRVRHNRAQCPGHNGKKLSLKFSNADDGKLLLYCHSHHCSIHEITSNLGLSVQDLFPNDGSFNLQKYLNEKAKNQCKSELIHHYQIVLIVTNMVENNEILSEEDKQSARNSMKILERNNFSDEPYKIKSMNFITISAQENNASLNIEVDLDTAHSNWEKLSIEDKYCLI